MSFRRLWVFLTALSVFALASVGSAFAAVGDGSVDDVAGDSVSDVLVWVQDNVIENAPTLLAIFIALALFGFGIRVLVRATRYVFRKLGMLGRGV